MNTGGIILFMLLLSSEVDSWAQSQNLTKSEFTNAYYQTIKKQNPGVHYFIEKDLVIRAQKQQEEYSIILDNAYAEYNTTPGMLNRIISKYSSTSAYISEKDVGSIEVSRIVPIIKPIEMLDQAFTGNGKIYRDYLAYEPYNNELIVVYAQDTDKRISYLTNNDLEQLDLHRDTLLQYSVNNLSQILPDIKLKGDEGAFRITAGGEYDASLILLESLWMSDSIAVDGEYVIGIPNRHFLSVMGSNSHEDEVDLIKGLIQLSYEMGARPISPHLFIWRGDKFEKYDEWGRF